MAEHQLILEFRQIHLILHHSQQQLLELLLSDMDQEVAVVQVFQGRIRLEVVEVVEDLLN